MRRNLAGCAVVLLLLVEAACARPQQFQAQDTSGLRWFKGNTHAHTLESDGDSPPEVVAQWYRDHGYRFLVLTDHNVFTDPAALSALVDSTFILIAGEEVTSGFDGRPVHVNGLNIPHVVEPRTGTTLVGTIQANVDAVREVDGVPHINHPNFGWSFGAEELLQVHNDKLLEIFNGHPSVHNAGGGGSPGLEEIWDVLLTAGQRMYGIAVDDAHHFEGEFEAGRANPGRGWVAVKAAHLAAAEIMTSLEAGRFYASTGVELEDVIVTDSTLEIRISGRSTFRYTTTFIGNGGQVLATVDGTVATFDLSRSKQPLTYVRARVDDSGGFHAWVQPVFVLER